MQSIVDASNQRISDFEPLQQKQQVRRKNDVSRDLQLDLL